MSQAAAQRRAVRGETTAFALLALVGAASVVGALQHDVLLEGGRVGPGLLPLVCGGLLALLGAVSAVRARRDPDAEATPVGDAADIFGRTAMERVRHLWIVFGLLLVTLLLVTVLGFLISFGLFVLVVSTWIERRRILPSLLITAVACLVVWGVFVAFLGVPLPTGLLGV